MMGIREGRRGTGDYGMLADVSDDEIDDDEMEF